MYSQRMRALCAHAHCKSLLLQLLIIRYPQLSVREHRPRGLHLLEPLGRLRLVRVRVRFRVRVRVRVRVRLTISRARSAAAVALALTQPSTCVETKAGKLGELFHTQNICQLAEAGRSGRPP